MYDLGVRGPQHVLQDSLTSGMCDCTCDGVHYPLIMPALIVALAEKVQLAQGVLPNSTSSSFISVGSAAAVANYTGRAPTTASRGSSGRGARRAAAGASTRGGPSSGPDGLPYGFASSRATAVEAIARTVQWVSYPRHPEPPALTCVGGGPES